MTAALFDWISNKLVIPNAQLLATKFKNCKVCPHYMHKIRAYLFFDLAKGIRLQAEKKSSL